jgi:hypothetical protein
MTIKISSAKAKGRNLQKWACEQISKLLDLPWGYEDDKSIQPRTMGMKGTDVVLLSEARYRFPYDVECKATEKISLYADIEQAQKNTGPGRQWLLVHKRSRYRPIVIVDAEHFFELLRR